MSRTRKLRIKLPGFSTPTEQQVTFVNPGQWFGRRWLIGVGAGFFCMFYIVEADCEQDAINELTDSPWGSILKTDEDCPHRDESEWDNCTCDFAGNYGERVDLSDIRVLERLT